MRAPFIERNPNGPQDIEITENSINDLLNIDGDGGENTDFFKTLSRTGTTTQSVLRKFGQQTIVPQQFASPVTLKRVMLLEFLKQECFSKKPVPELGMKLMSS